MRRAQVTAILLATLLFAAGAFVGVLGDRYYTKRSAPFHGSDDGNRQHYLTEMRTKLHLTPDQVQKLEAVMDITRSEFKAAHNADMIKIKKEHVQRVQAILTPAQLPLYKQLVAEHERHAREMESREH